MSRGIIVKLVSGAYTVKCGEKRYVCKPRGVFRHKNISPQVGDYCEIDTNSNSIIDILPRKNSLIRPVCSNVDKVFLVFSVCEPNLNLNLLDRMLAYYEYNSIECIIIFTKLDLLENEEEFKKIRCYYEKIGYRTFVSKKDLKVEELSEDIKDSVCVFAGQSGVGKSTLLNLFGFNIKTDQISYALGRGKHTTRHVELMDVAGGMVADTPGFGMIDLEMDVVTLSQMFKEFFQLAPKCKFNCCTHINEPRCAVKESVEEGKILKSRYENYLLFVEEIKKYKKKY